jgi:hypothetical protein
MQKYYFYWGPDNPAKGGNPGMTGRTHRDSLQTLTRLGSSQDKPAANPNQFIVSIEMVFTRFD